MFFYFVVGFQRGKKETKWPAEKREESPETGDTTGSSTYTKTNRRKLYMTLKNKQTEGTQE